jgi:hypothetical protein
MQAICEWLKSQSEARLILYYMGLSWLSAAYAYRWPVIEVDDGSPVLDVVFASFAMPIYWFFRLATVGF